MIRNMIKAGRRKALVVALSGSLIAASMTGCTQFGKLNTNQTMQLIFALLAGVAIVAIVIATRNNDRHLGHHGHFYSN